jgi:glycosyltransferase involved in cell wall biosynthesis
MMMGERDDADHQRDQELTSLRTEIANLKTENKELRAENERNRNRIELLDREEDAMSQELPFVSCLCCTYRHPALLRNALSCFLAQDYPADRRELVILDDSNSAFHKSHPRAINQWGSGWGRICVNRRFASLAEKNNAVASLVDERCEYMLMWDDDDVYLPWHVSAHVQSMMINDVPAINVYHWSKPSKIYSLYNRANLGISIEDGAGRFHGSIGFNRSRYAQVNGWPCTRSADHDQQFLGRLGDFGKPRDPCDFSAPSYVYRWETTGTSHHSAFYTSATDEAGYARYAREAKFQDGSYELYPEFDEETKWVYGKVDKLKGIIDAAAATVET